MAKYLLLKHYRGGPAPVNDVPMDQWTPEEVDAHMTVHAGLRGPAERIAASSSTGRRWRPTARGCGTTARGARR